MSDDVFMLDASRGMKPWLMGLVHEALRSRRYRGKCIIVFLQGGRTVSLERIVVVLRPR